MRLSPAFFYGGHQIFTKLAPDRIGEGLSGFVVEAIAAISILPYLAFLWLTSPWNQQSSAQGIFYSVLTGICISGKTIAFFLLFQKAGPLSRHFGWPWGNHGHRRHSCFSANRHPGRESSALGSPSFGLLLLRKWKSTRVHFVRNCNPM
jgi:hypothetical protein